MKRYLDDDFLLNSSTARDLFHEAAKDAPIIDFHCHLSAREIADDVAFGNITELWLRYDHYKWRAMRTNGVDERFITGDAPDYDKFLRWADTMDYCMGNPLFHWTSLELKRYFGVDEVLGLDTAPFIWRCCNEKLSAGMSARWFIRTSRVAALCTTDDPTDSLDAHIQLAGDKTFSTHVWPTFRADNSIYVERNGFPDWVAALARLSHRPLATLDDYKAALRSRMEAFQSAGCRMSDLSVESYAFCPASELQAAAIFERAMNGEILGADDANRFKTHMLTFLGCEFARLGWIMQLHIGAVRNTNSRMYKRVGKDAGFDSIGELSMGMDVMHLLDQINSFGALPTCILYCLNPRDNAFFAAMTGSFQDGKCPAKIQFGPAWWFNDHKDGIQSHLATLASLGLLSRSVGMTTDSRSFVSYPRHEYFRRILCDVIGGWVERGEAPADKARLEAMVRAICYGNAQRMLNVQ